MGMRLCQKCVDATVAALALAVRNTSDLPNPFPITPPFNAVPESECEFWAHKELNAINKRLDDMAKQAEPVPDREWE
jgi:hypothetical protein